MRFVLATQNRHKLREFALILAPHEVVAMTEGVALPPEGTESFAANARAKARALREAAVGRAGKAGPDAVAAPAGPAPADEGAAPVGSATADEGAAPARSATADEGAAPAGSATADFFIADDSGLEVEALGWGPGVISSRYAGREGEDRANIEKLLAALAPGREEVARRARFVCEVACLTPGGLEIDARGEWWGRIAAAPLGGGGFGYDPVFVPDGSKLTVAQWTDEAKNCASHRARAARALLARLAEEGLLGEDELESREGASEDAGIPRAEGLSRGEVLQ